MLHVERGCAHKGQRCCQPDVWPGKILSNAMSINRSALCSGAAAKSPSHASTHAHMHRRFRGEHVAVEIEERLSETTSQVLFGCF